MRKRKKFLIIAAVAVAVLAASLGTVVIAHADDETVTTTATSYTSIWDRIAAILNQNTGSTVTGDDVKTASDQARQQIKDEALENRLQKLVQDGKINQEQADEYKAWLESRPDTMISDEYKAWLESQPDNLPFGMGERMQVMERGFGKMGRMFCR